MERQGKDLTELSNGDIVVNRCYKNITTCKEKIKQEIICYPIESESQQEP